jgi:hypothetical protein
MQKNYGSGDFGDASGEEGEAKLKVESDERSN